MRRDGQAGLTMVEIMVSLLLVSVAAAFVFSIQMRTSTALRDQQAIAEMQQTLRSASDQLVRDLRGAGYLARKVRMASSTGTLAACTPDGVNLFELDGLSVDNSASGPDLVRAIHADSTVAAAVTSFDLPSGTIDVDDVAGFSVGDTIMVVSKSEGVTFGVGCVLTLTSIDSGDTRLIAAPGSGVNVSGNCHCQPIAGVTPALLMVTRPSARAYRISPSDIRGVLQMSPTAGVQDDWVDMAVGIVDLQMALRVVDPGDVTDDDGDGNAERDWMSGDNMESALSAAENQLLTASVTLVAKTTKEVNGVLLAQTPDIMEPDAGATSNRVGDRAGTSLPVTDTSSMYHGDFVYRSYTSTVDLRNMGVGQ
jgi:prepilin-type N-terminal cleavage/methylation domain-containing protein